METITIDGKDYDIESMSEDAKNELLSIQMCDQKVNDLQAELAIVQTARNAYILSLKSMLEG